MRNVCMIGAGAIAAEHLAALDACGEARLLAVADSVTKLAARCTKCGKPATRTQRLVDIKARIYVGGADDYEARCADCFNP